MDLKNKNILVTGGVVRVGKAIVLELLKSGANLYCHYNRSHEQAKKLINEFPQLKLLQGDLRDVKKSEKLIDQVLDHAGRIDGLVNNAAIFQKTALGEVTEEIWNNLLNTNLKPAFFLSQKAGNLMKQQGSGKIINIADTSGYRPWPSYIPYSITKGALINMTRGLAKALAPQVQVNAVNPGPVLMPVDYDQREKTAAIEKTLLKKEGRPEDIAHAVRFLIEDGDYITGMVLAVDGGRSII